MIGVKGQARARARMEEPAVVPPWRADPAQDRFGDPAGFACIREVGEQQHEVVAAKAVGHGPRVGRCAEQSRQVAQHHVAGVVAERFVDVLEIVQVEVAEGGLAAGKFRAAEDGGSLVEKAGQVGQAGQPVPVG